MSVAEFTDPRLAVLYDRVCEPRDDIDFYIALAGDRPLRVLDLCCGTGKLATALAERGHTATGIDAAGAMLDVARSRPGGKCVRWIEADVRDVRFDAAFDLVVLSGHAFQAFLDDAGVQALLRTARSALVPGGWLAFETRNPLVRGWEEWTPERWQRRVPLDGGDFVAVHAQVHGVRDAYVDSELRYRFSATGEELTSRQVLRFMGRDEVADHLVAAGFAPERWYGDWDCSPFEERSPEIIVLTRPCLRRRPAAQPRRH